MNPTQDLPDIVRIIGEHGAGGSVIQRALHAVRTHLGMDVAYVSEFVGDRSVFRVVDAPGLEGLAKPGDSHSLDDVYCRHILAGRLPELIPDTAAEPIAAAMPITAAIPIGRHMSIPIRLADGRPFGMFCCLGRAADPTLGARDLAMMRVFAELATIEINRDHTAAQETAAKRDTIRQVIAGDMLTMHYQPIWNLAAAAPDGVEALARFTPEPYRSPDRWFADAAAANMGETLEIAAIHQALGSLAVLPGHTYLSINASPETVLSGALETALAGTALDRIVLEITEHAAISDYARLTAKLHGLRAGGLRLAVDDAGAGYASLSHILALGPDLIKIDMSLTRGIDGDQARQALVAAMAGFARDTGCRVIAEGVETFGELTALRTIGIELGQGYLLGRPLALPAAADLFRGETGRRAA
jgi:EAL domain-containing protein (putative c-di-GMP-specific phosphodiesterase class I)